MGELSEFLRSRRARLQPQDVGLVGYGTRRRVPGLRREELAQLAGISADYYIRLEQGRLEGVSDAVLDAVSRVLRLDATEHAHLRNLVRSPGRTPQATAVRPAQRWLLDSVTGPAYILGARTDVVAWNDMACALYGVDFAELGTPNMARLIFLDHRARDLWVPWEDKARDTVGGLRVLVGLYPEDAALAALLDELAAGCSEFGPMWSHHRVWTSPHGTKRFRHPLAGEFSLHYEAFAVPGEPDRTLVTYTAEPGTAGAAALGALADPNTFDRRVSTTPRRPAAATTNGLPSD